MQNVSFFTALTRGWRLYRLSWKSMAVYALLVWIATLCLLSPLVSWVLNRLIARSGELVIGNSELLSWLLSPTGLITLLLSGALTLMGFLLYFAGMIRGSKPSLRNVQLTKCALRQASMPTTQRGNFFKVEMSANRSSCDVKLCRPQY